MVVPLRDVRAVWTHLAFRPLSTTIGDIFRRCFSLRYVARVCLHVRLCWRQTWWTVLNKINAQINTFFFENCSSFISMCTVVCLWNQFSDFCSSASHLLIICVLNTLTTGLRRPFALSLNTSSSPVPRNFLRLTASRRSGVPTDCASIIVFLCSSL